MVQAHADELLAVIDVVERSIASGYPPTVRGAVATAKVERVVERFQRVRLRRAGERLARHGCLHGAVHHRERTSYRRRDGG